MNLDQGYLAETFATQVLPDPGGAQVVHPGVDL